MTRMRRAVTIIGPWRVSVSLVCGVALTVLIAWSFALQPWGVWSSMPIRRAVSEIKSGDRDPEIVFISRDLGRLIVSGNREPHRFDLDRLPAADFDVYPPEKIPRWVHGYERITRDSGSWAWVYAERGYGWPTPALVSRYAFDGVNRREWSQGWDHSASWPSPLNTTGHPVPLEVHAPGFLINACLYVSVMYAFLSARPLVSGVRRRLGNRCHPCGYRLEGLASDTCPECGWVIRARRS